MKKLNALKSFLFIAGLLVILAACFLINFVFGLIFTGIVLLGSGSILQTEITLVESKKKGGK